MDEEINEFCNYYGQLHGQLIGNNVGVLIVDQCFIELLEKYETRLSKHQVKLLASLKKSFIDDIKLFKKKVDMINTRFTDLEKKVNEIKKGAKDEKSSNESKEIQEGNHEDNEKKGKKSQKK